MKKSIFYYNEYKSYLREKLGEVIDGSKLSKQSVATYIGCKPSYLSQVLNSKPDLTLDQAHKINLFFAHNSIETQYFLLLVELGRASTIELKKYLKIQIKEIQESRLNLIIKAQQTEQVSREEVEQYYSTWLYSAIHISLALPDLQEASQVAKRFHIPVKMATEIIQFLESSGLVYKEKGRYQFSKKRIHLDRDAHQIQRHHINWRSQALQSVEKNFTDDLHYSIVFALSHDDINKVKDVLIQAVSNAREVIRPSASEDLYAITLDYFRVN